MNSSRFRRHAFAISVFASLVLPTAAGATVITAGEKTVRVAGGAASESVVASSTGNTATFQGKALMAGRGCEEPAPGVIECTLRRYRTLVARFGSGRDSLEASGTEALVSLFARLGRGNDEFVGGQGRSCASGGEGNDSVYAVAVRSHKCPISGGQGRDRLESGDGRGSYMFGGRGNDVLTDNFGFSEIWGEEGDDVIRAGTNDDRLSGGEGNDRIIGGNGDDVFLPDPGRDVHLGGRGYDSFGSRIPGDGPDLLVGGRGSDSVDYICAGCSVSLDGRANDGNPGEGDNVKSIDSVRLTNADATRAGIVTYGEGDDFVKGNGQTNYVSVYDGDDAVLVADGKKDFVTCGNGDDRVVADRIDELRACEDVELR